MGWLDRLMERLTARGPKLAGSGHPPADVQPPTGAPAPSEELEADDGPESPAAEPRGEGDGARDGDSPPD